MALKWPVSAWIAIVSPRRRREASSGRSTRPGWQPRRCRYDCALTILHGIVDWSQVVHEAQGRP